MIAELDHIILKKEDCIRLFQVHRNRTVIIEKFKFVLDGAINHPFGTTFEVKDGRLFKATDSLTSCAVQDIRSNAGKDNRGLNDIGDAQKLSKEEIDEFHVKGITGTDIVDQLVQNSATFRDKTVFSQQKYLKKKKQKYVARFTILKPTTRLLCDVFYSRGPQKILRLRVDSLAQILSQSNVRSNSKV